MLQRYTRRSRCDELKVVDGVHIKDSIKVGMGMEVQ